MDLLTIILVIIGIGVLLWLVNSYVPMDAKIKKILNIFVVVAVIVWLLKVCHVWQYLSSVHV